MPGLLTTNKHKYTLMKAKVFNRGIERSEARDAFVSIRVNSWLNSGKSKGCFFFDAQADAAVFHLQAQVMIFNKITNSDDGGGETSARTQA